MGHTRWLRKWAQWRISLSFHPHPRFILCSTSLNSRSMWVIRWCNNHLRLHLQVPPCSPVQFWTDEWLGKTIRQRRKFLFIGQVCHLQMLLGSSPLNWSSDFQHSTLRTSLVSWGSNCYKLKKEQKLMAGFNSKGSYWSLYYKLHRFNYL